MEGLSPPMATRITIGLHKHLYVLQTFIPHLLCARHNSKHLANVNLFVPHNHPMK